MKSMCVNNKFQGRTYNIKVGQIYETSDCKINGFVYTISDTGYLMSVPNSFFIPLQEWRQKRINMIDDL